MFVFLFILGGLLFAFGGIAMIMNLPEGCQNMTIRDAFSESFANDKFTYSVLCLVIGFLIVIFCLSCMM